MYAGIGNDVKEFLDAFINIPERKRLAGLQVERERVALRREQIALCRDEVALWKERVALIEGVYALPREVRGTLLSWQAPQLPAPRTYQRAALPPANYPKLSTLLQKVYQAPAPTTYWCDGCGCYHNTEV